MREDIPQVMELRRQVRVHDVPSVLQTWLKIDPEGMKVAVNENALLSTGSLTIITATSSTIGVLNLPTCSPNGTLSAFDDLIVVTFQFW
ncbi:hypothetical protein NPIL_391521 [Nephila pilipes]|uniref:Uncharacterized protein n=1 Tax=Nephila pilipes TaxID=299642 RepID=A0A8X6NPA7_NEPPI|nr:hypothetical protein NPIL_391521 [Nephila pilipes]